MKRSRIYKTHYSIVAMSYVQRPEAPRIFHVSAVKERPKEVTQNQLGFYFFFFVSLEFQ